MQSCVRCFLSLRFSMCLCESQTVWLLMTWLETVPRGVVIECVSFVCNHIIGITL